MSSERSNYIEAFDLNNSFLSSHCFRCMIEFPHYYFKLKPFKLEKKLQQNDLLYSNPINQPIKAPRLAIEFLNIYLDLIYKAYTTQHYVKPILMNTNNYNNF